jgi:uncharacterized Rmd1/YagE family protein
MLDEGAKLPDCASDMPDLPLIPLRAYAFTATLVPRDFYACFGEDAVAQRSTKTQLIVRYPERGWASVYDFGAVVFIDVPAPKMERALSAILARLPKEPHPPLVEEFGIVIDPSAQPSVTFDRVTLPELDASSVEVVSLVVAQSVGMEYYEEDVAHILGHIEQLARGLAETGRFRGSARPIMRFVGEAMLTRNQVVYTLALLDAPLATWESEPLARVYRALRTSFEIEDRYRALDHKLRIIGDNLELFADVSRYRRTMLLELGVFLLVLIEVVLFVWQIAHPVH